MPVGVEDVLTGLVVVVAVGVGERERFGVYLGAATLSPFPLTPGLLSAITAKSPFSQSVFSRYPPAAENGEA